MRRRFLALLCISLALPAAALDTGIVEASLPAEARETLRLIDRGGPFPYPRDGITFHNRERRLPEQSPGYYREYTVPTPGSRDRGARRIITGEQPPAVFYYTADHYETFRRIQR
ncbi:MAG: guanyl-specific ribonuclease Sa [Rhodocyclaceae bacterium]|nr:MAG: guanyl-specific ribonuclease Sa [Rhodocyclaceae bacterium]TND04745.1 MAG: guanyl-specific ribonuclease Sa [Rhodocyclaceae bacterium]